MSWRYRRPLRSRSPCTMFMMTVSLVLFMPGVIEAASLRTTDDGNIELRAYDERAVFRLKDAATIYVDSNTCDPPSGRTTLQAWLTDPKVGACLDRTIPDHVPADLYSGIALRVSLKVENGLVYPGKIEMDSLAKSSLEPRQVLIGLGPLFWNLSSSADEPGDWKPGQLKYELMEASKPWVRVLYRLPAADRQGNASRPLLVACEEMGAVVCSVILRSKPGLAVVKLSWRIATHPAAGAMSEGPIAAWTTYDRYARAIADSIFRYRPNGDLQ